MIWAVAGIFLKNLVSCYFVKGILFSRNRFITIRRLMRNINTRFSEKEESKLKLGLQPKYLSDQL